MRLDILLSRSRHHKFDDIFERKDKSKKSVKVQEETLPAKTKKTPSTVKLAAKNRKKQAVQSDEGSENDQ